MPVANPGSLPSRTASKPLEKSSSAHSVRRRGGDNEKGRRSGALLYSESKLRRSDSNRRPSGYEPDELPLLHSAPKVYRRAWDPPSGRQWCGEADGEAGAGGVGEGEGAAVTR
jgi:hypothetical protein